MRRIVEPKTLQEAITYFADVDRCIQYLAAKRWPDDVVVCPICGRKDAAYVEARRVWQCKSRHPKAQFSIKVGTIFEDSPIALGKWLMAMWMVANCKNGVSSHEIARSVGVTQKVGMVHECTGSGWHMGHDATEQCSEARAGGPVEVDETFIGPDPRKMHSDKREARYKDSCPTQDEPERGS
jgi:hypothetical protein